MTPFGDDEELDRLGVLAATMGAGGSAYHVGFVVADLADATATMSTVLDSRSGSTNNPPLVETCTRSSVAHDDT